MDVPDDGAMNETTVNREPTSLGRATLLHLPDGLDLRALQVTDAYWEHRVEHPELANGRVLSIFDYTSPWTWWERHTEGDEFVHVITGEIDFLLDDEHEPRSIHLVDGEGTIVPQGAWHRAVLCRPSTLLFVTPTPATTEHRDAS